MFVERQVLAFWSLVRPELLDRHVAAEHDEFVLRRRVLRRVSASQDAAVRVVAPRHEAGQRVAVGSVGVAPRQHAREVAKKTKGVCVPAAGAWVFLEIGGHIYIF